MKGSVSLSQTVRALQAGCLYFALVFVIGFALGIVRTSLLVPRFGVRYSELLELPFMVAVSYLVARSIVPRLGPFGIGSRAVIGLLALALLISAELGLTVALGQSMGSYIAGRDPVSGSAYLVSLMLFAFMPIAAGGSKGPCDVDKDRRPADSQEKFT